jgi:threonine dehydrogenase-like Zn-dependent dehydrogenase
LDEPGRFAARDASEPVAPPGHALVAVKRVGVCGTDLHAFAGRQPFFSYPRVLGHELGVEVLAVTPGEMRVKVGDRCAVEPYLNCGTCGVCRAGRTNCCETLKVLGVHCDGGMTERIAVPLNKLFPSMTLSLDQLALVETLGIGRHAVERAGLKPETDVLVVGAGPIGLAVVQFAKAAGATVRVLELNPVRRAFVERFGAEAIAAFDGQLTSVVFDATGSKASMGKSLEYVAFGGTIVFVGLVNDKVAIDDPLFHRREVTLKATRNSAGAFPDMMRMIDYPQNETGGRAGTIRRTAERPEPREMYDRRVTTIIEYCVLLDTHSPRAACRPPLGC